MPEPSGKRSERGAAAVSGSPLSLSAGGRKRSRSEAKAKVSLSRPMPAHTRSLSCIRVSSHEG